VRSICCGAQQSNRHSHSRRPVRQPASKSTPARRVREGIFSPVQSDRAAVQVRPEQVLGVVFLIQLLEDFVIVAESRREDLPSASTTLASIRQSAASRSVGSDSRACARASVLRPPWSRRRRMALLIRRRALRGRPRRKGRRRPPTLSPSPDRPAPPFIMVRSIIRPSSTLASLARYVRRRDWRSAVCCRGRSARREGSGRTLRLSRRPCVRPRGAGWPKPLRTDSRRWRKLRKVPMSPRRGRRRADQS
jgi:hypothetical protein